LKGLLITIGMKGTARRVAVANICFNALGVLLLLPFLRPFSAAMADLSDDPGISGLGPVPVQSRVGADRSSADSDIP
jgi:hypothetical protein